MPHHPPHNHSKDELIAYAEKRAAQLRQRWTAPRAEAYDALLDHTAPITAYALLEYLSTRHGRDIKPASVYRALEALCDIGIVVKIESLNAFRACRHPQEDHRHLFLVCDGCGHTDEIADHGIGEKLSHAAAAHGFKTGRQVLELHGICRGCRK
jgi:Fur family transcriptional regulator, zinc uptake regulator